MQQARMLGNYVQFLASTNDMSITTLSNILGCNEDQAKSFLMGRSFASFEQLTSLASAFNLTVADLLKGNEDHYNATVVHCMNKFQDNSNREKILDIIDNYMDITDAIGINGIQPNS